MSVRAKFKFSARVETKWHQDMPAQTELTFTAEYDDSIPEDRRFAKATPSGSFKMVCDVPEVLSQFELGKYYYFDITPV